MRVKSLCSTVTGPAHSVFSKEATDESEDFPLCLNDNIHCYGREEEEVSALTTAHLHEEDEQPTKQSPPLLFYHSEDCH